MATTLQELVDKAVEQAGRGLENSTVLDMEGTAESLLPQVFKAVAVEFSGDERRRSLPRLVKTVTFTNGSGTLSSDVLTELKFDSSLYDSSDVTKVYSLVPEWDDFIRVYDTRIGYYWIRGLAILAIEPGETYAEGAGISASRKLIIGCTPAVPATASAAIDASDEFVLRALDLLVERLSDHAAAQAA